jgi:hypothetical protein
MSRLRCIAIVIAGSALCGLNTRRLLAVDYRSPLREKAEYLERDLVDNHSLDGLYVSIVPSRPSGTRVPHTVNEPGNVIHAGVWTGRYLAGVGYQ